jgi:hypothetical protein
MNTNNQKSIQNKDLRNPKMNIKDPNYEEKKASKNTNDIQSDQTEKNQQENERNQNIFLHPQVNPFFSMNTADNYNSPFRINADQHLFQLANMSNEKRTSTMKM